MASQYLTTTFLLRRGLAENWTKNNPTLRRGEPGFEVDTNKLKIGNGTDAWADLPYIDSEIVEKILELEKILDTLTGDKTVEGSIAFLFADFVDALGKTQDDIITTDALFQGKEKIVIKGGSAADA